MARRQYSDSDKAAALAALDWNEGNVHRTAQQLGIPRATLQSWANGRGMSADVPELRQQKKGELVERLKEIAHQLIDALPAKIADANLQQTATSLGIVLDKAQLLDGKPTERNAITDESLTDDERATRIVAILDAARARRDGRATNGAGGAS